MEKSPEEQLKEAVSKWQTAFFLSQAMLEDYASTLEKITGEAKKDVKDRIMKNAQERMDASKKGA